MTKPISNPYEVLGLQKGCSEKDIQKAYKVQCLKWHPDKNLTNKEEAEKRFIAAKEAFEFLYDKEQRAKYDQDAEKVRVRDEKLRERMEKADGARRKFIDELNRKEKEFAERHKEPTVLTPHQEEAKRKREEKRIRADFDELRRQLEKEASDEVHAQQERLRRAAEQAKMGGPNNEASSSADAPEICAKLRLRWTPSDGAGDYDEDAIRILFKPYGEISEISPIMTTKKGGKMCVLEFVAGSQPWGAELENGAGVPIKADWRVPPVESVKSAAGSGGGGGTTTSAEEDEEGKKAESAAAFAEMSFEELQAKLLADMMGPPVEKKAKKWHEEEEH